MLVGSIEDYREDPPLPATGGGGRGGGGTNDQRLPLPEAQMVRVEEQLEHLRSALADLESAMRTQFATKACVLGGVLGGMGIAAGVAATVVVALVKLASP